MERPVAVASMGSPTSLVTSLPMAARGVGASTREALSVPAPPSPAGRRFATSPWTSGRNSRTP